MVPSALLLTASMPQRARHLGIYVAISNTQDSPLFCGAWIFVLLVVKELAILVIIGIDILNSNILNNGNVKNINSLYECAKQICKD